MAARVEPGGGAVLGYFFGPRLEEKPTIDQCRGLAAGNADLVKYHGYLGLLDGTWSVIGELPNWNRDEWPMVSTIRRDLLGFLPDILVHYDPDDPSKVVSEEVLTTELDLPSDGLAGHKFVEEVLDRKLAK